MELAFLLCFPRTQPRLWGFVLLPWLVLLYHQSNCQHSPKANVLSIITKIVLSLWIPARVPGIPRDGPQTSFWKLLCCLSGLVRWQDSLTRVMGGKRPRKPQRSPGTTSVPRGCQLPEKFIHCFPVSQSMTVRHQLGPRVLEKLFHQVNQRICASIPKRAGKQNADPV